MYHAFSGRDAEAERVYFQYRDGTLKRGELDTWYIDALTRLSLYYQGRRMFPEAEWYASRAVELRRQLHKTDDHLQTLQAIRTLAWGYVRQGRDADAEVLYRQ